MQYIATMNAVSTSLPHKENCDILAPVVSIFTDLINFHPETRKLNLIKEFKGMADVSNYASSTEVNPIVILIPTSQKCLITNYLAIYKINKSVAA